MSRRAKLGVAKALRSLRWRTSVGTGYLPPESTAPTPEQEAARASFYDDPAFAEIDEDPIDVATRREADSRGGNAA